MTSTFEMVEDPHTNPIVSWSQTRNSFIVWDSHDFSKTLFPKYFKHNNFSSFVHQLKTYVSQFSYILAFSSLPHYFSLSWIWFSMSSSFWKLILTLINQISPNYLFVLFNHLSKSLYLHNFLILFLHLFSSALHHPIWCRIERCWCSWPYLIHVGISFHYIGWLILFLLFPYFLLIKFTL